MARSKNESDEQKNALDAMAQVLQGSDFVEGMDNYDPTAPVPKSPIVSAEQTARAINNALGGGLLAQNASVGSGMSSASVIAYADKDRYKQMLSALDTQDNTFDSPGSRYTHQGYSVTMPGAVLSIPNKLYTIINNKGILFKKGLAPTDKAYKLLDALFGEQAVRVREYANRHGFGENPLVRVSQELWHHAANGIEHDYKEYSAEIRGSEFDPDADESGNSPYIMGLRECFEPKTIKDLIQVARFANVSVITVIRCIMKDACTRFGIPVDFGVKKEAAA